MSHLDPVLNQYLREGVVIVHLWVLHDGYDLCVEYSHHLTIRANNLSKYRDED